MNRHIFVFGATLAILFSCSSQERYSLYITTQDNMWVETDASSYDGNSAAGKDTLVVNIDVMGQVIQGFGTAFSELSHDALSYLSSEDREAIMRELFAPGAGASFTVNRTPIASNDFSRDYYSYDDVEGDFMMEHFSVKHDEETLIPLIKDALAQNPQMKIWASPWCPPVWLKTNKHYATRPMFQMRRAIDAAAARPGGAPGQRNGAASIGADAVDAMAGRDMSNVITDTGIRPEQYGREGMDMFMQEPEYLQAYALYFQKYVQAYREYGIDIYMVMPQNEPNSAQWYPSCVWTAAGLLNFMRYLCPAMDEIGVEVMHGTMERADWLQADTVLSDPVAGPYIQGAAFQWAGSAALPRVRQKFPDLTMVMSEHQCHNGRNSWEDFIHSWELLKFYMDNGVSIYEYWNLALCDNQVSSWGWSQNSLVCVNKNDRTYKYNPEYYLMKHASRFIRPGAVYLDTAEGKIEALAFRNPDGEIVILLAEKEGVARNLEIIIGSMKLHVSVPANSLSTLVV